MGNEKGTHLGHPGHKAKKEGQLRQGEGRARPAWKWVKKPTVPENSSGKGHSLVPHGNQKFFPGVRGVAAGEWRPMIEKTPRTATKGRGG